MKLLPTYNAPFVLTFSLLAFLVHWLDSFFGGQLALAYFAAWPDFHPKDPWSWFRIVSHVLGHKDMAHLVSNFSVILLIGPILEEKYGSRSLMLMTLITVVATGILNTVFFNTGLMGASGVVFMMIVLGSFANHKPGEIPLTFIFVVALYLVGEVTSAFKQDNISQFAHLLGGLSGAVFGFRPGILKGGK
jgi:membrane associated rhomboid family serine protease